jgi:anti-anti-sigma regulatory factor
MGALQTVGSSSKVVILALGRVPSIDATGLVALESALTRLRQAKKQVVLTGPLPEPHRIFDRANLPQRHDHIHFAATVEQGLALADQLANPAAPAAPASTPRG